MLAALSSLSSPLDELEDRIRGSNARLGAGSTGANEGIGSNNWVISGKRTATGMPMLANDPHLDVQMPSIWYEVGLHCAQKSPECPFEVTGFSFPGVPGVVVGHNDRIAWGFTNIGPDVAGPVHRENQPQ